MAKSQSREKKEDVKRKPKVFSESLGIDHLVQLSNDIASKYENAMQTRVDKAKEKQAWIKEKNRRKNGGGGIKQVHGSTKGEDDQQKEGIIKQSNMAERANKKPLTKSSIRAGLVAAQREKARMRKEARKMTRKASENSSVRRNENERISKQKVSQEAEPTDNKLSKKRVSFA